MSLNEEEKIKSMAYVAYCHCGGMIFASVDDENGLRTNAREVPKLRKSGFKVDRITVGEVRKATWCQCKGKPKP